LPLGTVSFEREPTDEGERLIWLAPEVVLRALRARARATATLS